MLNGKMTFQDGLKQIDQATQKILEANQLIVEAVLKAFLFTCWIGPIPIPSLS